MKKNPAQESLLSIHEAANLLKVSTKTLRRWEEKGILIPQRTEGKHRRYKYEDIASFKKTKKAVVPTIKTVTNPSLSVVETVTPQIEKPEPIKELNIAEKKNDSVFNFDTTKPAEVKSPEEILLGFREYEVEETKALNTKKRTPVKKALSKAFVALGILMITATSARAFFPQITEIFKPTKKLAATKIVGSVLADTSILEDLQFTLNVPTEINADLSVSGNASVSGSLTANGNFSAQGQTNTIAGILTLSGNTLSAAADLTISPVGGAVRIGTVGTPTIDMAGGDLYVSNQLQVNTNIVLGGDTISDFVGTGLALNAGSLETTLGTSVTGDEITDDTIKEVNLLVNNDPTNGKILSYNDSTGGFTWIDQTTASESPFQTTANVVNLTTATDDVTIGSATDLAKLAIDGDSDEVQLLAQGSSGQTANILVVENSAGTDIFTVGNEGNTTLTNSGASNVVFNLASTGDFEIQDNGTTYATFTDSGSFLFQDLTFTTGTIASSGNLTFSPGSNFIISTLDCTSYTNGGALTANASGVISCSNDDGGGGASDWTSSGGVVYLQTSTNNVTIGGTSNLGKLAVDGDTNEVQLLIQGNNTQTNFLGLFEQSGGTDVFSIANNGDLVTAGDLAVNGGDITTSSTTASLFNTTATTLNIGGAASTINVGVNGGTMTISSDVTITGTLTTAASNFAADGAAVFSPSGTNDVTMNLDSNSTLILNGLQTGTAANGVCIDASNNVITCNAAITIDLQDAYDNDTNGSNSTVVLSSSDDSIVFQNPSSSGTDSGYILSLDQQNTGNIDALQISQAGTGDSAEITNSSTGVFLNLIASGTGTTADGISIMNNTTGVITDAIDASDPEIVNAINAGANTILGTSAVIDFTNFDVDASGNVVAAGTVTAATNETINGIDITTGTVSDVVNLTINSGGDLTIGTIGLNDLGSSNTDSGASLIGVFDEFANSNSTTVQDVLDDLDSAIGSGASKWTDGGTITYLTQTTDDVAVGASNTLVAPFSVDVSANLVRFGTGSTANAQLDLYASDGDTGSLTYNTSDQFNFTGGDILAGQAVTISGTTTTNGDLTANATFTLGDNGDTGAINTSDWDISTTGVLTGISGITTDGAYTQSGSSSNTLTGATTLSGGTTLSRTLGADSGTTQNVTSITFTTPADTTGTNTNQGLNITPTIGNATGGTNSANIINIGAVTGDAQVSLNAVNIGALTGTGATETAFSVGAGWDNVLSVGGSAIINGSGVLQSSGLSGSYSNALTLSSTSNSITAGTFTINSDAFTDLTGNGLAVSGGSLLVNLSTSGGTGSTSSNSGLEVGSGGLSLLKGCAQDEILSWDDTNSVWKCNTVSGAGGGGGDITAVGDVTSGNAFTQTAGNDGTTLYFEGATADGNEIALTSADPGSDITVTLPNIAGTLASLAGTQTFSGAKTFDGALTINSDADFALAGGENVTLSNTSASTDQLALSVSGVTTTGVDALSIAMTQADDADATDTNAAVSIALTSSSGDADTLYGIQFADFTGGTAVETALRFGTGFNNLFEIEGSTADGNNTVFTFSEPTGSRSINIPDDSGTICLSSGNCAGGAGGSKWTDAGSITYLTSTTDDVAVGGTSLASAFSVDVSGNLVRVGTGSTANAQLDLYASDGDTGSLTYNTSDQFSFSGGDVVVGQALTVNGTFTLGDNGDTGAIDTSDWDISTTGALTGISGITTDGAYTQSGSSANTLTGATTLSGGTTLSRTLGADSGTTQNVTSITFTTPADTTGTNTNQGLNITPTIGNATGGTNTANIITVGAVAGDAQVTLNAVNIGALTGTGATETAINIGSGWDNILSVNNTPVINGSGQIISSQINGTLFSTSSDSGSSTVIQGDTLAVNGGTNGIDTTLSGDSYTINFDATEVGTTTFGSGSAVTWTFDASAGTDTSITFGNDAQTLTTGTLTLSGTTTLTASSLTTLNCSNCINFDDISNTLVLDAATTITRTSTTTSEDSLSYTLVNNGGTAGTDQALVISNGVSTNSSGDTTTESLITLDQADTTASGNTALTQALLITNSGGSTLTNAITIGSGSQAIATGINIASTGVTTDLSLQNGETIDNNTDGTITITAADTALSGDLAINGGNITTAFTADSTVTVTGTTTTNGALTANGTFTLGDNGDTGAINTSDWDISATGDMTGIGSITADGAISFTPGSTSDVTFALDSDSTLVLTGVQSGTASSGLCLDGSNNVITCSTAGSTTLQTAYNADADGSDATIQLTTADDSLVFNNPSSSGTDSGFILNLKQDATGAVDAMRVAQAGTGAGITMTFTNAGTTADGLLINNSSGTLTDAIDVSDATGFTNAINVGANTILGTTADIDMTNFDVAGGTGNITTAGDIAVNGDDVTSDGNLTIAATGYVRIGDTGTPGTAAGDDDLYVEGDLEVDATANFDSSMTVTGTATLNGTLDANGQVDLGDGGDTLTASATTLAFTSNGAGNDITFTTADDLIINPGDDILATFLAGSQLVIDASSTANTTTGGVFDLNVNAGNAAVIASNIDFVQNNGAASGVDAIAEAINLTANDADGDVFGSVITANATANAAAGSYEALLKLVNAEDTAATVTDAILVDSTSGTNGDIVDAIDVSDANITNGINLGANFALFDGLRFFEGTTGTLTLEDTSGNDIATFVDGGTTGSLTVTNTISAQGNSIGLNNDASANNVLSFGTGPGAATGDLYWGDKLLCTAASSNCGWTGGSTSPFTTSGGVIDKVTAGDRLRLQYGDAADVQLEIENTTNTVVPTADVIQLNLTGGSGITTDNVDGLFINIEGANGTSTDVSAIHLDFDPISGSSDDTFTALLIDGVTGTSAVENAITVGSGWDANFFFNDTTTQIQIADTGVFTFEDANGNDLMTLTDNSNAGDLVLTGNMAVNGGSLTSSASTFNLLASPTTVNFAAGATTALNIGNAASAYTAINIGSGAGTHTINLAGTGATSADTINIGTGGTAADTINIGSSASSTSIGLTTGTGSQTFTSSVATGTTTTSAFVFAANSINTGTAGYLSSSSITSGKLLQLTTGSANTFTSGNLLDVSSTSTALTSGRLGSFDWSPSATTATGDLVRINIGSSGTTTGYLLNITDNGVTDFGVSETQITSALPHQFTAAGDVSVAYDLQFTNQTASFIRSNAPLTIDTGEAYESNNLTLRTYNNGNLIVDLGATTGKMSIGSNITPVGLLTVDNSNTGTIGKAVAIFNQDESQDILTASKSGATKFFVDSSGITNVNLNGTAQAATQALCHSGTDVDSATDTNRQIVACSGSNDLAEWYEVSGEAEAGDILVTSNESFTFEANQIDPNTGSLLPTTKTTTIAKLTKSSQSYQTSFVGIVTTSPDNIMGPDVKRQATNPHAVAVAGRTPVKIASNSDPIAVGDYVTISSEAGRAMKATQAGVVIGKALQSWTPGSEQKVEVFVMNSWFDPIANSGNASESGNIADLTNQVTVLQSDFDTLVKSSLTASDSGILASFNDVKTNTLTVLNDTLLSNTVINGTLNVGAMTFDNVDQSINAVGVLKIQSLALGNIEFQGGLVTIDTTGNVVVNTITAQKYKVAGASAGTGVLTAGTTEVSVSSTMVSANSLIFVTAKQTTDTPLAVTEKVEGDHFTVSVPNASVQDIEFDWFIVDKVN